MRFSGRWRHSVDTKGRFSVPANVRKALPEELVISKAYGDALYVFSEDAFTDWVDSFFPDGYDQSDARERAIHDGLFEEAEHVVVDSAGRIKLSAEQREWARIGKEVVISGQDDHLAVKDAAAWDAEHATRFSLDDLLKGRDA